MRLFSLDNRLSLCASLIREGVALADIGTDHAYLPVWLVLNNKINSALACDINKGPLKSGSDTISRYSLDDKIETRLSDGLSKVSAAECDDIVIAGMGAELIVKILSECSWAKTEHKHYILQPMTKCELLISWLYENGFEIISQKACESDSKHYTVMLVHYTGNCQSVSTLFSYIGKLDPNDKDSVDYICHIISHLKKRSLGDKSLLTVIKELEGVCNNAQGFTDI